MMNMQLLNRSGLAAIAVATALISTHALGQETTPVAPDPAPIVADEPLTIEPLPTPAPESDTLAPAAAAPAARTARPTRATASPAARAPVSATRSPAPAAAAAQVAAAPATPTSDAVPPADPAMVAPLPEPVAAAPVAPTSDSMVSDDLLPIAGAAGLGILAIVGAGFAMRRRRRDVDEPIVEDAWNEPAMSRPAPVVSPKPIAAMAPIVAATPVAASAFGWDKQRETGTPLNRIEAAKRGPTADNPSLSLKKRLKRAAFFDQRDRQVAAGTGTPVLATAGLPEAMTAASAPTTTVPSQPVRRPATNMSFGKSFQPA